MKVAQNDETNPDTEPREYFPDASPFTGITSYRVRTRLALPVILFCTCLLCIYCFFPLFSPVDYETDAAAAQFDYGVDDPSYLPEQPGKPPLDHQISPILLYTACIRVV